MLCYVHWMPYVCSRRAGAADLFRGDGWRGEPQPTCETSAELMQAAKRAALQTRAVQLANKIEKI